MLMSLLLPPRRPRAGQGVLGCGRRQSQLRLRLARRLPRHCQPPPPRVAKGGPVLAPWQGRRGQEYQGMNKRVCACNDLKLKPLLVQSMQRFQKRTKIGRRPGPPARGPAQMQTVY